MLIRVTKIEFYILSERDIEGSNFCPRHANQPKLAKISGFELQIYIVWGWH